MAKPKYYVVWEGRKPGIYATWAECQDQVKGHFAAKFKAFAQRDEAEQAYKDGPQKHWGQSSKRKPSEPQLAINLHGEIEYDSISVDVGTRGNPGPIEYKGVDTRTGEVLFEHGPIPKGTNNLGEFLAIVHALAFLNKQGSTKTIYSDSVNAINWVRKKRVSSTLERDESTQEVWELVDRAEKWLDTNRYSNKVLKWQTQIWGEIKADYGRK